MEADSELDRLCRVLGSDASGEELQAAVADLYRLALAAWARGDRALAETAREALEGHRDAPSSPEVARVLQLTLDPDVAAGADLDRVWVERHLDAAKSFAWTGQYGPAAEFLAAIGPRASSAEGSLLVDLHLVQADVMVHIGRPGPAAAALEIVDRALERGDLDPRHVPLTLYFLATSRYRLGQYPAARALLGDAIAGAQEAGAASVVRECWNLLGILCERDGDLAGAVGIYDRVLDADPDADSAARTLVNRGRALRELGELAAAREDFEAALELAGGKVVLVEAGAEDGLARVALAEGRLDDATRHLARALAREREHELEDYLGHTLQTEALLDLARGDAGAARAAMEEAEGYLTSGDVERLTPRSLAQLRSRYARWTEIGQEIASLEIAQATSADARERACAAGFWQAGRWSARALLAGMRRSAGGGLDLGPGDLLEALAALLGERRVLVRFVETTDQLHAYVVHGGEVDLVDLGAKRPIFAAARKFVDDVCESALVRDPAGVSRLGHDVFRMTLGPALERAGGDPDEVVIVPVDGLAAVPFEATTRSPEAESFEAVRYVAKDIDVVYAPSAPCLAYLNQLPDPAGSGRGLFLGDIVVPQEYGGLPRSHRLAEDVNSQPPLPASRREAIDLALKSTTSEDRAQLYAEYGRLLDAEGRDQRWSTASFDVFLGRFANCTTLADADEYRRIHIAAHSFVDRHEPFYRGIVLSPSHEDDGMLDLAHIRSLKLDAELVVLSGCGTARGRALGAEGVQSIAAAFLEAGGKNVVASLWVVDDGLTSELMADFYDELARGGTVQFALEQAKRSLWKRGPRGLRATKGNEYVELSSYHPKFWAAFVYFGCPR